MSSDQTWVEALKISPESLSEWSQQAPSGTPLLVWCLTNGHVNLEEYLEWARQHYGLAVLDSRFFTEGFKNENLQGLRNQPPWTSWCFPIGEWDDVTFVACTEPPSEMPEGQFAFVLADPNAMKHAWGEEATGLPSLSNYDAPVGINPNLTRSFVLNLDDSVLMTQAHAMEPNPAPPEREKTGVTLSVVLDKKEMKSTPPPVPTATTKPTSAVSPAPAPTPTPVAGQPPASAPPPPAAAPAAVKPSASEGDAVTKTFERLHETYQSALVMRVAEGVAHPYKWDPQLPISEGVEKFNVNLNYPSFLRIVAKTHQPYHGYVIDSPAHREFFENLDFQDLPACVSAVPLKSGEKIWGILVAFGGESAKSPDALDEALAVSEKIALILGLNKAKAA